MDPKLNEEQTARIMRLMERYDVGERVRAVETIVYASSQSEIPEGTLGHVRRIKVAGCDPLVSVAWLGYDGVEITSAESLEPVDRPAHHDLDAALARAGRGAPSAATLATLEEPDPFQLGGDLDLRRMREDLRQLEAAWTACMDDLVRVGVLRTGHVPPDGVARLGERWGVVGRAGDLLDVLIKALDRHG